MSKTTMIVALLFPAAVFAAIPVSTSGLQRSASGHGVGAIGAHRAQICDQLSMGPDPGGKTGDTVTPATTKTGQPSADGASNQSGANGGQPPAGPSTKSPSSTSGRPASDR